MESESEPMQPRDPTSTVIAVFVALIVLSIGVIGYVMYDNSLGRDTVIKVVQDGDTVLMNYIGMLTNGRVFDTSMYDVASDNVLYPKSLTFSAREADSYTPFEMTAGLYGESGGTIQGFALGVIGMKLNEKGLIVVEPDEGYSINPDMLETVNIMQEVPVIETILETEFMGLFGTTPVVMTYLHHYLWDWDVQIISNEFGYVTYKNLPKVGDVLEPYGDPADSTAPLGWYCVVRSYDPYANDGAGEIIVENLITSEDVYEKKGVDAGGMTFILWSLDTEAGTFQIHRSSPETGYNGEISGRTLLFEVTILNIT